MAAYIIGMQMRREADSWRITLVLNRTRALEAAVWGRAFARAFD